MTSQLLILITCKIVVRILHVYKYCTNKPRAYSTYLTSRTIDWDLFVPAVNYTVETHPGTCLTDTLTILLYI